MIGYPNRYTKCFTIYNAIASSKMYTVNVYTVAVNYYENYNCTYVFNSFIYSLSLSHK